MGHDHFAAVEERFDVDADEAVEFSFLGFVARGCFLHNAGVIDYDVEFAICGEGGVECFIPGFDDGDVP